MYCYDKNLLNDNKRIVVMIEMYYNDVSSIVNDGIGEVLCVSQKKLTNLKSIKSIKRIKST